MPFEGGGNDQPVGGVAMETRKQSRPYADQAVDRDFDQSLGEKVATPGLRVYQEIEPPTSDAHGNFPEGYGRDRRLPPGYCTLDRPAATGPETTVSTPVP